MRSDLLRMLGWIIPIVCMAIAAWVLYGQNQAFADSRAKRDQASKEVQEAQKEYDLYQKLKPGPHYAAEDDIPLEETAFLNYLRTRCAANSVRFDKYQTQTITYGKDKGSSPPDPRTANLLKGIRKVSSTLTFVGEYANVRRLLGELEASDRLYTLTNIAWVLAEHGTALTMTISRYVQPAKPDAKPKPGTPTKPGAASAKGAAKPGAAVVPMNSVSPGKPGASPSTVPLSGPGARPKTGLPPNAAKPSTVSPGVPSKP